MDNVIRFYGTKGPHGFLSNFYRSPFADRNGQVWPTVEHAFQAMKSLDPHYREAVLRAETPAQAKAMGRGVTLRPGWSLLRTEVMRRALAAKFAYGSELSLALVRTTGHALVEDSPTDYFWGIGRDQSGLNMLGALLEERRNTIHRLAYESQLHHSAQEAS